MKTRHPIFQGLKDHHDTSIAQRVMKAYDPTSQAPKVRHDTSIARRAMSTNRATSQAPTERPDTSVARRAMSTNRATSQAPTERPDTSVAQRAMTATRPKSKGLKDRWIVSMVVTTSMPSVGLSDLGDVVHCIHSPSLRFGLCWYRIGLSDLAAPTNIPSTEGAPRYQRSPQGYVNKPRRIPGLKDRRIFPRLL